MQIMNFFATDAQGNIMPGALCYLYNEGTTVLATGLQDISGNVLANPFESQDTGLIQFKAPNGTYDLRVVKGSRDYTLRGVQCADIVQVLEETAAFLGTYAAAPSVRPDGTVLQLGDRYFNSTTDLEYLYKSTGWEPNNLDGALIAAPDGSGLVGYGIRTVEQRLGDVVSVKDTGALGGGVDDTAAFVAAKQMSARPLVPDGLYSVDGKQVDVSGFQGSPDAVLSYQAGQRVAIERAGNADSLEQLYWQEVKADPGATLSRNATHQAIGICNDVMYMTQNVSSPSGIWASDSVVRVSSFLIDRAPTDTVDVTVSGGSTPTAVVDLVGLGHGSGASVISEGGKLFLYSTISAPSGQAPIDGIGCNYGTGFTKTEWKGSATVSADVQSFPGLKGVFSGEVCVSSDSRYLVIAGYRFTPVVREDASYYSTVPWITIFDRLELEGAADPTTVFPLNSFAVPYVQSLGDAIGSLAGVACDGELIYVLNSGAQMVGARSIIIMSMGGGLIDAFPVSGWAGTQPDLFRKGAGGKVPFAFEIEGLAIRDDTLMMVSKFNLCTPSTVVSWLGKNFIPVVASTNVSPTDFGSWARTEAPAVAAWNSATAYAAPTALLYHKYLTALAPKGRYARPHGVADGLYLDGFSPAYMGGYGGNAGYTVAGHFFLGQYDRNTETVWPMLEFRSSGAGKLFDADRMKEGPVEADAYYGRLNYDYDIGITISAGASVATAATLVLTNARDSSVGNRYGVMFSSGTRSMLWGTQNLTYKNFVPNVDASLVSGSTNNRWLSMSAVASYVTTRYYTATVFDAVGTGTPEGVVAAGIGSTFRRTDGGTSTTFYVKQSGTGNTGWVAK